MAVDRFNEEVKRGQVLVLPQANQRSRCRYFSGSILSRSGLFIRSIEVYSHSVRPKDPRSTSSVSISVLPSSSVQFRIEVEVNVAHDDNEEELRIISRLGTATKWDAISHSYGWLKD